MNKSLFYTFSAFLSLLVVGCDNATQVVKHTPQEQAELQQYLTRIKNDLVYVKGGTFWMGDFCKKMRDGGAFCSTESDNKPLHEIELSSFSIGKFKVTHESYSLYLRITGQPERKFIKKSYYDVYLEKIHFKNSPAIVTWTEADKYCAWLGKESGLPFSLPSEAQWEYAARNRGHYILVATDDGNWRADKQNGYGENFSTDEDRRRMEDTIGIDSTSIHFPVDKYPPSPLGLYGMADNGWEWVSDWYDPQYYDRTKKKEPKGPDRSVVKDEDSGQYLKVLRGVNHSGPGTPEGLTFSRTSGIKDNPYPASTTVRCVVNSPEPLK